MSDNNDKIKVAFIANIKITNENIGGADIHTKELLKELSKNKKLEMNVITMSKNIKDSYTMEKGNIIFHYLASPKMPITISGIIFDPGKIVKKVNEIKPDIVHAQILGAPEGFAAMKLCKKFPTILTVHTLVEQDANNRIGTLKEKIHDMLWKHLEKKEITHIPKFIAVSKYIERELKKRGAQNVQIIPNGISDSWFDIPNREVKGRILFVGRVIPIKDLETLIHALKYVKAEFPVAELHIVGSLPDEVYKKKLDSIINSMELLSSVIFSGQKTERELEQEYSECSLFILPSINESFGIVLLEAMAASKSIIASNVGAIPEVITNGKEGFLFESGNEKQLAEKIIMLLRNSAMRRDMGSCGKERATKFKWCEISEKTFQEYNNIIENSIGRCKVREGDYK